MDYYAYAYHHQLSGFILTNGYKLVPKIFPEFDDEVLGALEICQSSNTLSLTDTCLRNPTAQMLLFQAVQSQFLLRELHLSACSLHDTGLGVSQVHYFRIL
jgi:hypothetical protein